MTLLTRLASSLQWEKQKKKRKIIRAWSVRANSSLGIYRVNGLR